MAKDTLARDSLASVTLDGDILASDTLARVTLWPVFLASFEVPKDEKKIHRWDHREKFEKLST